MEVLRRAVGDKKLTFMGFSYGTAVASFAANMFPDRFRAIVADGVINPVNYVGTPRPGTSSWTTACVPPTAPTRRSPSCCDAATRLDPSAVLSPRATL
jgi:pimeloyl-ACP methyl ester carboxylesterase